MQGQDPNGDLGGLVISNEVLAAIAVTAARDVGGVSAVVPRVPELARLRNLRWENQRYVKLSGEGGEVTVELWLRVRAGIKLTTVAGGVQRAVKDALQGMTGKIVTRVNIKILGIDF